MKYQWEYRKLGDFVYNVLPQSQIKPFLLEWIKREWEIDRAAFPDQPWTQEWLDLIPRMDFDLEVLRLADIRPRKDLMTHKTPTYDFMAELDLRVQDREESLLRGVTIEPLVVNRAGLELMDGYTRHIVLERLNQDEVFAYVGSISEIPA
jgi:hypothetical protein